MVPHFILLLGAVSLSCAQTALEFDILVILPRNSDETAAPFLQSWRRSEEILDSAENALNSLNGWCFPFRLGLTALQTDCNAAAHDPLVRVVRQLTAADRTTVAVAGIFCRPLLAELLGITQSERLGTVRVALNPALPELTEQREKSSNYYQLFPSGAAYADTLAGIMQRVGWTRIVLVTLAESYISLHTEVPEQATATLAVRGLTVVKIKMTPGEQRIRQTVRRIHASGLKAVYVQLPPVETALLMCDAYEYGLRWPDYGWVIPDISLENVKLALSAIENCAPQVEEGAVSFHATQIAPGAPFSAVMKNNTCSDHLSKHQEKNLDVNGNIYARAIYDFIHKIYFSLNNSFPDVLQFGSVKDNHFSNINFQRRVSELIGNGLNNSSRSEQFSSIVIAIYQTINSSPKQVAVYDPHKSRLVFDNFSTGISLPSEDLDRVYWTLPPQLDIILTAGLVACVLFIFVNMCLYIYYRRAPEMKASSVEISMIIYISCYIMCVGCGIHLKTSTHIVQHTTVPCTVVIWATQPWGDLTLATLLVQVARIYHIFNYFGRIKKYATDRNLLVVIALIFLGKVVILSLWTALDPYRTVEVKAYHSEGKPPYYEVTQHCYSDYSVVWNSVSFGYTALLTISVAFISYKTRKIRRKDFKNTKKINVFLSVVVTAMAVLALLWWVFRRVGNTAMSQVVLMLLYLLLPVACQACLFCPKTFPPLQRNVLRLVCKKKANKTRTRTEEKIMLFQKPDPSQLSLCLARDTDSSVAYSLVLDDKNTQFSV